MRKDSNFNYMQNIVGKTIQSVHRNLGYIIKFTDGTTLNITATLRHELPVVSFLPPLDENSIAKEETLNQREKDFLIQHVLNDGEHEE